MTGGAPLTGTLVAAAVLTALHVLVGFLVARNKWFSRVVEGGPIELGSGGRINHQALRRTMISDYDIHEALRAQGVEEASETKRIVLEANGAISVIKKMKDNE